MGRIWKSVWWLRRISDPALGKFPRSGNEQSLDSSRRDLRARSRVALSFEENPGARIRAYHEIFPMTKESRCNCCPSIMLQTLLLALFRYRGTRGPIMLFLSSFARFSLGACVCHAWRIREMSRAYILRRVE